MTVRVNDIVQVTNQENDWFPCLVVVSEIKAWGIQGYTSVPCQGDAYIRLQAADYEKVGTAIMVSA